MHSVALRPFRRIIDVVACLMLTLDRMAPRRPRKPPVRTTSASIYVRCQPEEKAALEAAAAKAAESLPGARLPVTSFVLAAALERAAALGFTVGGQAPPPDEKRTKGGGR